MPVFRDYLHANEEFLYQELLTRAQACEYFKNNPMFKDNNFFVYELLTPLFYEIEHPEM